MGLNCGSIITTHCENSMSDVQLLLIFECLCVKGSWFADLFGQLAETL